MKDDAPAFPRNYSHDGHNGMTLRDYFAGEALNGLLSHSSVISDDLPDTMRARWRLSSAHEAYAYADAMLKARQS